MPHAKSASTSRKVTKEAEQTAAGAILTFNMQITRLVPDVLISEMILGIVPIFSTPTSVMRDGNVLILLKVLVSRQLPEMVMEAMKHAKSTASHIHHKRSTDAMLPHTPAACAQLTRQDASQTERKLARIASLLTHSTISTNVTEQILKPLNVINVQPVTKVAPHRSKHAAAVLHHQIFTAATIRHSNARKINLVSLRQHVMKTVAISHQLTYLVLGEVLW